jgi:hypothetical protein
MRTFAALLLAAAALAGCDKNCQNTCAKIYDQAQCNVVVPGEDADTLRRECISECQAALTQPGDMNGYNPYDKVPPASDFENFVLENEKQAAEWMECVASQECDQLQLEGGICWPIP